ncbi:MAG TPA: Gfo/Idh/MocA family oxidoreductase, partial [Planctomycetaceae bacterium]|nr:Gfo/Idh/MocA family oxidoreductase [Planctomycetaceae bacterium]
MAKLRVGIVGIKPSGMAAHRARNVLANPECELAGLCCRTERIVKEMCATLGGKPFTNYDEMAASPEIDAICVSIRNRLHYPMAKKALEGGKHVLVEYPMVTRLEEFDELLDLARQKGLVIHHGLNVRHETLYKWLEEALGRIGEPISI